MKTTWRFGLVDKVIGAGIGLAWVAAVVWLAVRDARESWRARHAATVAGADYRSDISE